MAAASDKDVHYMFKQFYGRNASKDELTHWKGKDPFLLRDALVKSGSPEKKQRVRSIYEEFLGKGVEIAPEDLVHWSNKTTDDLRKNLAADPRSEIYASDVAIREQAEKQKADTARSQKYYAEEYDPTWQKLFDRDQSDYEDVMAGYKDRQDNLNINYKRAMSRGDTDLARNLKRMHDDYTKNVTRMAEDRDVYVGDLEKRTGRQLRSTDVNYAERNLFRSGARKAKREFVQQEAAEEKGKYQKAYQRRYEDVGQYKTRETATAKRGWARGKQDLGTGFKFASGQLAGETKKTETAWDRWKEDRPSEIAAHKANYMQTGKQESILGTTFKGQL